MTATIVGLKVPNFSAPMTSDQTFNISDYRGKHLVIYFYPKDSTPGCTDESIQFNDMQESFAKKNCLIFGVSRDSVKSHENFRSKYGFKFELISDGNEEV